MIIIPANTLSTGGFDVDHSLRFRGATADTYLTATFGATPTLATKNTISLWFKRSKFDATQQMYATNNNAANIILNRSGASTGPTAAFYSNSGQLLGPRLYRDTSAWMHFVFAFDSTQGTAANRFKVYINGIEETSFNNTAYPAQDEASQLGVSGEEIQIGTRANYDRIFDGYMCETAFVDGQALDATSFGEFDEDSGVWKPIDLSDLTFGNNGFYLEYKGTGTNADSSGIGADTSGNDLHFAVNAFTAADQSTDTCTNNFCTFNALFGVTNQTLSEGNLKASNSTTTWNFRPSTIGASSGKWYAEYKITTTDYHMHGVADMAYAVAQGQNGYSHAGNGTGAVAYYKDGPSYIGGGVQSGSYGNSYGDGDIIGIALDMDNAKVYFSKNGTFQNSGDPTSGATGTGALSLPTTGTYTFTESVRSGGSVEANFGSPPYSESGGETDGNGYGNFAHAVPSGYYALCTKNLAEYG